MFRLDTVHGISIVKLGSHDTVRVDRFKCVDVNILKYKDTQNLSLIY